MTDPITTPAQMREAAALLPCPFCGGEAYLSDDASHSRAYFIGCNVDDCFGEIHWEQTKAAAIAAWNRRAPPVAEQQAIRDRALDDAAQAVSNRAAYWWAEAAAADDTGRKKLSLSYEAKALACIELAAVIRVLKEKPE